LTHDSFRHTEFNFQVLHWVKKQKIIQGYRHVLHNLYSHGQF
jgi:hypothetical protein